MNAEDLRQHIEGLIQDTYELGVAHANHRRLAEGWTDKIDQFRIAVGGYMATQQKTFANRIIGVIENVAIALKADVMTKLTGKQITEQMGRRTGIIETKNAIIAEVEKLKGV